MPDIQTQMEVRMIYFPVYIQKKFPVLVQNVLHHDFQSFSVFQKLAEKPAYLICPSFPEINAGDHSGMVNDLSGSKFLPRLIALCKPGHRYFTDQAVKRSRVQIQERPVKCQRRIPKCI